MVARFITLCLLLGFTAGPVWACGILAKASPKVGSTVAAPVTTIRLTFSEAILPEKSSIALVDAEENPVETKTFQIAQNDSVMLLPMAAPLAAGRYKVHWQVLWKDCGSATEGNYGFSVTP